MLRIECRTQPRYLSSRPEGGGIQGREYRACYYMYRKNIRGPRAADTSEVFRRRERIYSEFELMAESFKMVPKRLKLYGWNDRELVEAITTMLRANSLT